MKVKSKMHFLLWLLRIQGQVFATHMMNCYTHEERAAFLKQHGVNESLLKSTKYRPGDNYCMSEVGSLMASHFFGVGLWSHMGLMVQRAINDEAYEVPYPALEAIDSHIALINPEGEQMVDNNSPALVPLFSEILTIAPSIIETIPAAMCFFMSHCIKPTRARYGHQKMAERLIGKFDRQMSDNMWPHYRERLRFASGIYEPVPQVFPTWTSQYVHLAKANEDNIAYTPNHQYLVTDRQLSVRPGRYLSREFSHLRNEQVKKACTQLNAEINRREWFIAEDVDGVLDIYRYGPESCMDLRHHDWDHLPEPPAAVYFSPDVSVAALKHQSRSNNYSARCVINKRDRTYGRVYGDPLLGQLLNNAGYDSDDFALSGCRVRCIPRRPGSTEVFVMPYLDYISRVNGPETDDEGTWFIVDDEGDWEAQSTSGTMSVYERMYCECCEDEFRESDMRETEDGWICWRCYDNNYIHAYNARGHEVVVNRESYDIVYSERDDKYFVSDTAAVSCGYVWMENEDDYVLAEETVEDIHGELIFEENAIPVRDDCGDWGYIQLEELLGDIEDWVAGWDANHPHKLYLARTDEVTSAEFVDGHFRPAAQMLIQLLVQNMHESDWRPTRDTHVHHWDMFIEQGQFPFIGRCRLGFALISTQASTALRNAMYPDNDHNSYLSSFFTELFHRVSYQYMKHCHEQLTDEQKKDSMYMRFMFPQPSNSKLETINAVSHYLKSFEDEMAECIEREMAYLNDNATTEIANNG
jgi:hypothetical protein